LVARPPLIYVYGIRYGVDDARVQLIALGHRCSFPTGTYEESGGRRHGPSTNPPFYSGVRTRAALKGGKYRQAQPSSEQDTYIKPRVLVLLHEHSSATFLAQHLDKFSRLRGRVTDRERGGVQ
jgi:hypothetical protein